MDKFQIFTKPFCYLLCLHLENCLYANFYSKVCFLFTENFSEPQNVIRSHINQNQDISNQARRHYFMLNEIFCHVNHTLDVGNPICRLNSRFDYLNWSEWNYMNYEPCTTSRIIWARSRIRRTANCNGGRWLEIYSKEPFHVNKMTNNNSDALKFCSELGFNSLFTGSYRILGTKWSPSENSKFYWSGFRQNLTTREVYDAQREQVTLTLKTLNVVCTQILNSVCQKKHAQQKKGQIKTILHRDAGLHINFGFYRDLSSTRVFHLGH